MIVVGEIKALISSRLLGYTIYFVSILCTLIPCVLLFPVRGDYLTASKINEKTVNFDAMPTNDSSCNVFPALGPTIAVEDQKLLVQINPFRTAVPFWGQTSQKISKLSPKRDWGSKGVKMNHQQKQGAVRPNESFGYNIVDLVAY